MKVCKYCGTENKDGVKTCSSCGANEFKYKCDNCGTVFEGGLYCPNCGIKAGQKAKICPNCGNEYYTFACPDCGYTQEKYSSGNTTALSNAEKQPAKKRKTWLWVLGWIFIFPLPLTILMVRNKELNKWVKIGIIVAAWIIYLVIGLFGDSDEQATMENTGAITVQQFEYVEQNNIKELTFIFEGIS